MNADVEKPKLDQPHMKVHFVSQTQNHIDSSLLEIPTYSESISKEEKEDILSHARTKQQRVTFETQYNNNKSTLRMSCKLI